MLQHLADKNIALDLVRVTEAAALASAVNIGRGDKEAVDQDAVNAMRIAFQALHIRGKVVVGEGEKDNAPMLFTGEDVGFGDGPEMDVAVDPVDGTSCVAFGRTGGMTCAGLAPKGTMFNPGHSYYAQKIIVGPEAAKVIDLDAPVADNLKKVAYALGKPVSQLSVFVLDKPRHEGLAAEIRSAGARVLLRPEGDIAGALLATDPFSEVDMVMGIGGTPEAIVTACGIKGSGGQMLLRFAPKTQEERKKLEGEDGFNLKTIYSIDDLIKTDTCYFACTGVTDGDLVDGVRYRRGYAITTSLSTRGRTGTIRRIQAFHDREKLSKMSSIRY
ncbi:MAG TPA: fructose-bisphosphatase class II [Succinivibrionaceae bacterium]|nr:fructose-bisphosphatase class II [Succinivibrionaceae bacterium]